MPPKSRFVQSTLNRKASSTASAPVPPPLQPEEVPTPSASAPAPTATPTAPRRSHSREAAPTLAPIATPLLSQEAAPTPTTTPAPPLLNEMAMVTGTLVEGAPKVPLRSIRCQNKDDGTPPDNLHTISSQKTDQLVRNNGGKPLDVVFSKFHNGPDEKERYDTFIRDLGCAVRDKVPMLATSFLTLTKAQQAPVMDYLKMYYNIPKEIEDGFVKIKSSKAYSAWKHECHAHFKEYGGDELPLEFEMRPEQWRYLVEEEFMNEAKQAICKRNKDNRNKNPNTINHHSGPIPMSFRAKKLIKGKKTLQEWHKQPLTCTRSAQMQRTKWRN